jgi:hypothetical protein
MAVTENEKVKWKLFPESTAGLWQVIYLGLLRHKDKVPINHIFT